MKFEEKSDIITLNLVLYLAEFMKHMIFQLHVILEIPYMKNRWLALLLAASMLVPTVAGLASCRSADPVTTTTTAEEKITSPLTSARAVDKGDLTYYLDENGALFTLYGDHLTKLADLGATAICVFGSTLWYATDRTLCTYNLTNGERGVVSTLPAPITSFALYEDKIYSLCTDKLYDGDRLLVDFATRKSADNQSLATICGFELTAADEILIFLPNPNYKDEETTPGYLLTDKNDTCVTYRYKLSADSIVLYNYGEGSGSLTSTSGAITINGVTLPFADYPVGSYFTQNGGACTCHDKGYCIENNKSWENCLRFWPKKSNYQVDLCGVQCMGFARFCQWRLYGSHDFSNTKDFYNAFGQKLSAGNWTANTVKNVFMEVGPGGHIRTGAGHSMFVISVTATGFVTYECNTNNKDCKIYTRQWTWDSFYQSLRSRDILYYNMPRNVDINGGDTPNEEDYKIGAYRVAANGGLNLRQEPNTSCEVLETIPNGTLLQITELRKVGDYYWGKTVRNDNEGWVRLDYLVYQQATISSIYITSLPTKTIYTVGDSFSTEGLVVEARFTDGTAFDLAGYTCTGYDLSQVGEQTVTVSYENFQTTFTITVQEKVIPPTSITLSDSKLTLLVGDEYQLGYTLLPTDTTQKKITWSSTDSSVVSVSEGVICANGVGSATVTATTENGLTAQCVFTIISMPTGTNWSATADGRPLNALPLGIEAVDYSIRYRLPEGDGWGEWIYGNIPADVTDYQCQFRSFTATFVDPLSGQTLHLFTVELNQIIDLNKYQLEAEGYLFAGWYYNPKAASEYNADYAVSQTITITGDFLVYAGWIPLGTMAKDSTDPFGTGDTVSEFGFAGIELKVAGESTGIRYLGRISTALIGKLERVNQQNKPFQPESSASKEIGFGMVAQMTAYINNRNPMIVKSSAQYLDKGGAVTVPAVRTYAEYNGYILFNAFVCGFSKTHYDTNFAARPYLTYVDANGIMHTHYFTYEGENSAGGGYYTNLYAEAEKMVADPTVDPVVKKWLEENILK